MADDEKKKSKPKKDGGPPKDKGGGGGPPFGNAQGPAMGGGAPPPMPGTGVDPYAALAGQISATPPQQPPGGMGMGMPPGGMGMPGGGMDMPMGTGMNGSVGGGGGMGAGMGNDLAGPGLQGSVPTDPITHALMSDIDPGKVFPDQGQHALDPMNPQGQMSIQQVLQLLALMQGGIPASGLTPPPQPGGVASGMTPNAFGI